jgi:Tfp pilus assembly protein PilF
VETQGSGPPPAPLPTDELAFYVRQWEKSKSDEDALEVLFGSMVAGDAVTIGNDAIKQLTHSKQRLQPMVKAAALAKLMGVYGNSQPTLERDLDEQLADKKQKVLTIGVLKARLRRAPRNPLVWADYARLAASLGAKDRAEHLLRVSRALAPDSRYIARCAVRLLVHTEKPAEAKHLLESMDRTKFDPWLLAADLAVSSIVGKPAKYFKSARDMADRASAEDPNFSELFGALSTHFYEEGVTKLARRYLHRTLLKPNDNSLAQAEWLAPKIGGIIIPAASYSIPASFEAKARHFRQLKDWDGVIKASEGWCDDEPFSTRAPGNASYVSAVATGNMALCQKFCELGLIANPNDGTLLNNLAVALAQQGHVDKARELLEKRLRSIYKDDDVHILGLEALTSYRSGATEAGRAYYQEAFKTAIEKKDMVMASLALLHQAQEELVAGAADAVEFFETVEPVVKKVKEPEVQSMLERLRTQALFLSQLRRRG